MSESVENKVISRIYAKGRGWSFSRIDFSDLGSADAIDQALSRLAKSARIRRVLRGLYDFPKHSSFLNQQLSPEIDQVARALARKFGWTIQVSESTALNILGLSTQVPARFVYHSDGRTVRYTFGNQTLEFVKSTLKDTGLKYEKSAQLVQAIKGFGQGCLTGKERALLRSQFSEKDSKRILKDTRYVTNWVYEEIKRILKD